MSEQYLVVPLSPAQFLSIAVPSPAQFRSIAFPLSPRLKNRSSSPFCSPCSFASSAQSAHHSRADRCALCLHLTEQCFHKFVIKLLAIKRFFVTQVQTAHWSYAATHWPTAATVRILDRNEVVYTGLAHRHRAIVKAAPFAVAANLPLASARCAHRCLVRRSKRPSLRLRPLPLLAQSGHRRCTR